MLRVPKPCHWSSARGRTLVHATSRLVGAIGLDNIVIVETPDAQIILRSLFKGFVHRNAY